MYICVQTITGINILVPNFDPLDNVKQFRKKLCNEIDRLNEPSIISHKLARMKIIKTLYLIRQRYIKINKYWLFFNLCNEIWNNICQMAIPLNTIEKPIKPHYPFSTKYNNFRIIVCGKIVNENDICYDWTQYNKIHIVILKK